MRPSGTGATFRMDACGLSFHHAVMPDFAAPEGASPKPLHSLPSQGVSFRGFILCCNEAEVRPENGRRLTRVLSDGGQNLSLETR